MPVSFFRKEGFGVGGGCNTAKCRTPTQWTQNPAQVQEFQAAGERLQLEVERLTAEAAEVPISELQPQSVERTWAAQLGLRSLRTQASAFPDSELRAQQQASIL